MWNLGFRSRPQHVQGQREVCPLAIARVGMPIESSKSTPGWTTGAVGSNPILGRGCAADLRFSSGGVAAKRAVPTKLIKLSPARIGLGTFK